MARETKPGVKRKKPGRTGDRDQEEIGPSTQRGANSTVKVPTESPPKRERDLTRIKGGVETAKPTFLFLGSKGPALLVRIGGQTGHILGHK